MQRVPEQGAGDIRIGSQVIARGSQVAVFFRDGTVSYTHLTLPTSDLV